MNFFGVSPGEAAVILVVALLVIGPQRFPEIMRSAGRWYRVARAYSDEVMKDVRAAVSEIEKEVNAEGGDLKAVRELGEELSRDLKETQQGVESVGKDTHSAAQSPTSTPTSPATPSVRPSQRSGNSPSTPPAAAPPAGSSVRPGDTTPAPTNPPKPASPDPVTPPASYYEGRDPSTFDPFKAKEAREREGADKSATPGSNTNGTNSAS